MSRDPQAFWDWLEGQHGCVAYVVVSVMIFGGAVVVAWLWKTLA